MICIRAVYIISGQELRYLSTYLLYLNRINKTQPTPNTYNILHLHIPLILHLPPSLLPTLHVINNNKILVGIDSIASK